MNNFYCVPKQDSHYTRYTKYSYLFAGTDRIFVDRAINDSATLVPELQKPEGKMHQATSS